MILVKRYIYCDGMLPGCAANSEPFQLDGAHQTAAAQRANFQEEGWHYWHALDLCPYCWPQRAEVLARVERAMREVAAHR